MVVNVNQCASMFDETLHALKYSAVAKQVWEELLVWACLQFGERPGLFRTDASSD